MSVEDIAAMEVTRHDVQRLMGDSAQLVEVLPREAYDDAHLPGAVHIPLERIQVDALHRLDADRPIVVYCYDALCDMSPRAAWQLVELGFTDVYDYVASKVDWIGAGLPFEGKRKTYLGLLVDNDVSTCGPDDDLETARSRMGRWGLCLVVNEQQALLGLVRDNVVASSDGRRVMDVMDRAPKTFRPHLTPSEAAPQIDDEQPVLVVTNLDGKVVGVVQPDKVRAVAEARE